MNRSTFSRRDLLALAGAGIAAVPLRAASKEFWDTKDPSTWTPKEIQKLLDDSPWAKPVRAQYFANAVLGCSTAGPAWSEHAPVTVGGRGVNRPSTIKTAFMGKVVWESAQPVRDARKNTLPGAVTGHYVFRVSDYPVNGEANCVSSTDEENLEKLKEFATLEYGGDTKKASVIVRVSSTTFLFGYPKDAFAFKPQGDAVFTCRLDRFVIEAKFALKDMNYKGQLAV